MRFLSLSSVVTIVLAVATSPAWAGPTEVYKEGLKAEKEQDFERAYKLYESIPPAERTVLVRLHISSMLVRLGRLTEAEEMLTALVKDPAASAVRETAQGDLDDLRARMPKVTVRIANPSNNTDLWVTLDGNHVGPPVTVAVNPGTHLVVATRAGQEVYKQKITIQDSQSMEVEIEPAAPPAVPVGNVSVPAAPPAPSKVTAPPKGDLPSTGFQRARPALAIGLVFAAGSAVSFVVMTAAQRSLESNCAAQPRHGCDLEAAGSGRVRTWETIGWISGGVAVAAIGVGVALWATGPKEEKRTVGTVGPLVGSGVAGLSLQGRF